MDQNNKKEKARRSNRVPKPKTMEKVKKPQTKIATENKSKKSKSVAASSAAENSVSKEIKIDDGTSREEIASNPKEPSGNKACKKQAKKRARKLGIFHIDCEEIDGSRKIDLEAFESFLRKNIQVDGKKNDGRIIIDRQNMQILISAEIFVEQKYIKFLIKKYLKKAKLHNWIKIENGKKTYKLKYFTM